MANELKMSGAFEFQKGNLQSFAAEVIGKMSTVTGTTKFHNAPSIATSEEALALGDVTAAKAFFFIVNTDDSNYVEIRTGTGAGNDAIYIGPREFAMGRFGSDITAPYAVANTAAVVIEYWLVNF